MSLKYSVNCRIGMALTDSLDELITSGAITPQLAMKVLQQVLTADPHFERRQFITSPSSLTSHSQTLWSSKLRPKPL